MKDDTVVALRQPESFSDDPLTEILRAGARQLLGQAIEAEVAAHIEAHADLTDASGRRRIVRHGHMPEREVQTGIGAVTVKRPRVRDRDPQATGGRIRFTSSILPPYLRRAKSVEALLPWLYLKGISSGDFSEALAALLGPDAPGLTASTIIEQTERRVLKGETVPAAEKLVSLFEPHSDIIVKGGRDVHYGHKLNLTSGKSGMILDVVIEAGNPADAERLLPMLERHIDIYGRPPRQMAADGGYASGGNLKAAKEKGVRDMAFHKKRGLKIEDMVRSRWVYRKLRNFRAGIEAGISCLKRAYGLARCTWKGLAHFKAYVWSSVVAYNLALFARLKPA